MPPRVNRVERLAIELRHWDCQDSSSGEYAWTRERSWAITEWLRDRYRERARRILRLVDKWRVDDLGD